jgi:hypothetical protein
VQKQDSAQMHATCLCVARFCYFHRHYASLDQVVQKLVGADNGAGTRIGEWQGTTPHMTPYEYQ